VRPSVYVPNTIPFSALAYLRTHCEVDYRDNEDPAFSEELIRGVAVKDGLLCYGQVKVHEPLLAKAPNLRAVSNIAVGYDNLDMEVLNRRGIAATNTPGVVTEATADLTFAILMAAARRIVEADNDVKQGRWDHWYPSLLVGKDIHRSTLGIIGMGRIGQAVAKRARGFEMRVLYFNRTRNPEAEATLGVEFVPLDELLAASDFIVVLTPLTDATRHFIGEREFARMKTSATFINASRGAVVDEMALIRALQTGQIASAALDVYEREPVDKTNPLLMMSNVVTLPHIGTATSETRRMMAETAVKNLVDALYGRRPEHLLNPQVWPRSK